MASSYEFGFRHLASVAITLASSADIKSSISSVTSRGSSSFIGISAKSLMG